MLVRAGMRLAARHIGLLTSAGVSAISVVRQPHERILAVKPGKTGASEDSNSLMIYVAVARDGGIVEECVAVERGDSAITAALAKPGVDIVLLIGGTGSGTDDHSGRRGEPQGSSGTESLQTHRWRELDSNFPYAGAMDLVFAPFVYRDNAKGAESL